ncbi:MAG: IS200/IS605 family transposase [Gordonibacter sp.]|uniref:IS200/IS605 family transposase n=1 Tax=Gordonibacter sp. TaxID=1968902 RepID=UPI002FC665C7
MNESSLAHTKWDCTYHIVWIPKYRRKVLYGEYRKEVGEIIRELIDKKKGCSIVEGVLCVDHVHVCLRVPPKYAISDILGYVKGKSALMIHDRHPEWRRKVGKDKTFWARGYYVSTVGLNESIIRQYIKNQEESSRFE